MHRISKIVCVFLLLFICSSRLSNSAGIHKSSRQKREIRPLDIKIGNENLKLNLNFTRNEVFPAGGVKVWFIEYSPHKVPNYTYHEYHRGTDFLSQYSLYQDVDNRATLFAYYENGKIYYDGIIGENSDFKIVNRMEEEWWTRDLSKVPKSHFERKNSSVGLEMERAVLKSTKDEYNRPIQFLDRPVEVMYPKLLTVVDYHLFEKLGKDMKKTLEYLALYWNAVALSYKMLDEPKIEIRATGVIVALDEKALNYVYRARNQSVMSWINGHAVLYHGQSHFEKEFTTNTNFDNYDSVLVMSGLDSGGLAGAAFLRMICSEDYKLMFAADDGEFFSVTTTAHELAHALGVSHDSGKCSKSKNGEVGTLMDLGKGHQKRLLWSECSREDFRKFAWTKNAECLQFQNRRQYEVLKENRHRFGIGVN